MKIRELIEQLKDIENFEPNGTVYIMEDGEYYDFTGFSSDDNNDVELYLVQGDEKA